MKCSQLHSGSRLVLPSLTSTDLRTPGRRHCDHRIALISGRALGIPLAPVRFSLAKIIRLLVALLGFAPPAIRADPPPGYALVWKDEFDGNQLDLAKWTPKTDFRKSAQNTPDAATVRDGVLTITTWTEGGKHFTGFLRSVGKFETTYGYFEARIRFHTTPGEWGAFWLTSPSLGKPIGDVAKAGAEIDVVEHRAVYGVGSGAGNDATRLMAMALHWDGYGAEHQSKGHPGGPAPGQPSLQDHWHTYALLWTPKHYVFYLDGKEQWDTNIAVSQRSEFLLLTCEVNDQGWAGAVPEGGFGTKETSVTKMDVDWVRVWQTPAPATDAQE